MAKQLVHRNPLADRAFGEGGCDRRAPAGDGREPAPPSAPLPLDRVDPGELVEQCGRLPPGPRAGERGGRRVVQRALPRPRQRQPRAGGLGQARRLDEQRPGERLDGADAVLIRVEVAAVEDVRDDPQRGRRRALGARADPQSARFDEAQHSHDVTLGGVLGLHDDRPAGLAARLHARVGGCGNDLA